MTFRFLDTPFGRNKLNLTGQTIGEAVILRAAFNATKQSRFWLVCPKCKTETIRSTERLGTLGQLPIPCRRRLRDRSRALVALSRA